jgi:hypothetical protein
MSDATDQTKEKPPEFDFSAFPGDSVFHERRTGLERRGQTMPPGRTPSPAKTPSERRAKKERRKRIDPTTFEKDYTEDELEFMTAVQKFKDRSGKPFPSYREVLGVAVGLGYRRVVEVDAYSAALLPAEDPADESDPEFEAGVHPLGHPSTPHIV